MNYKISIVTTAKDHPHQRQTETLFIQSDKFKFDVLKYVLPAGAAILHLQKLTPFTDRFYVNAGQDATTAQTAYITELLPEEAARIEQWTLIPR